jgi:DNA helicase-2/ATP-dependent DNA helicase PcrA
MLLDRIDELPLRRHEIRGNPAGLLARIVERIDALKSAGVTAERFGRWADEQAGGTRSERDSAAREREFAEIYELHDSMLRSAGAMDDIDGVLELTRLLGERPALTAAIAERFPHLIVDELEDACPAERSLIEALARGAASTVLSCDDEQGRGPCDAAAAWARQAIDASEVKLEPSWRYGGDLLDAAHAVVAPAARGADVPRRAAGPPTRVRFWCGTNERAEAQAVARDIEGALAAGEVKMDRICVAVPRGGGPARAIAAALEERRVPYRLTGPGAFFQRPEIRDVIAWLRLLADPTDAAAVRASAGRPLSSARSTSLDATIARRRKLDMVSALGLAGEPADPPRAPGPDRSSSSSASRSRAMGGCGPTSSCELIERIGFRRHRLFAAPRAAGSCSLRGSASWRRLDPARARRFEPRLRPLPRCGVGGRGRARRGAERADRRRDQGDAAGADQGARVRARLCRRPARRSRAGVGPRRPARRTRWGWRPHTLTRGGVEAPALRRHDQGDPGPGADTAGRDRGRRRPALAVLRGRPSRSRRPEQQHGEELFGPAEGLQATYRMIQDEVLEEAWRAGGKLREPRLDTYVDVNRAVARFLELVKLAGLIQGSSEEPVSDSLAVVNDLLEQAISPEQQAALRDSGLDA